MTANSLRWTTRDLEVMPDDGGWKRYEIIDGVLYVTRALHIRHQGAGGNIYFELESWSRQTRRGKPFQTPGVIFTPTDAVIPDVAWISNERLTNGVNIHRRSDARLQLVATLVEGDTLASPLLPKFSTPVNQIFQ